LLRRVKETGAIVVTQPAFIHFSGERYLSEVDPMKLPWLYRIGSLRSAGIAVAASSDAPVIPLDPLIGISAAVTRKAHSGQALMPEEAIPTEEALRMYTIDGAYASFQEDAKGTVAVGKLADLVVLSDDPTQVPAEEIHNIKVEKTMIEGEIVWERD
jgi:predicted amidohydrolase YtcJ